MEKNKKQISAIRTVTTSIVVSAGDILLNLAVAIATGSVVMLAQALQGMADMTTSLLLLLGVKLSKRKTNPSHPLGHGREVFFWTLLASIFALVVTGGFAIYRGIDQIVSPAPIENIGLAYAMLSSGLVANAYSLSISLRRLSYGNRKSSFFRYLLSSSLVETKTSMLVDLMGTLSAFLGLIAIILLDITNNVVFDGIGAVSVGLMTSAGAGMLIYNLRGFIVGQSPGQEIIEQIRQTAMEFRQVNDVLDLKAVTIGSGQVMAILEIHFIDGLSTDDIEKITDSIKERLRKRVPSLKRVQIEAETPEGEIL